MSGTGQPPDTAAGIGFALACYSFWGFAPLYFVWVSFAGPLEILSHRIVWSVILLLVLISLRGLWSAVLALNRRQVAWLLLSSVLIAVNWGVFVWAVVGHRVLEASLGYYINPLVSVLLGVLVLGEQLRPLQWLALAIAAVGVLFETLTAELVPWLGLLLAVSFGLYSLVRKRVPVDPIVGLGVETLLLLPLALGYLAWLVVNTDSSTATGGGDWLAILKLGVGGAVTITPLLLFGAALNRLPLSVLGFIQYLAPTLSLLVAVWWLGEAWRPQHLVTFGCIWLAISLFLLDAVLSHRSAPA